MTALGSLLVLAALMVIAYREARAVIVEDVRRLPRAILAAAALCYWIGLGGAVTLHLWRFAS